MRRMRFATNSLTTLPGVTQTELTQATKEVLEIDKLCVTVQLTHINQVHNPGLCGLVK